MNLSMSENSRYDILLNLTKNEVFQYANNRKTLAFWGPLISMTAEKKIPKKIQKKNNKKSEKSFQSGPNLMSFAFNRGVGSNFQFFFKISNFFHSSP